VLHKGSLVLVSGREKLLEHYPVNAAELEFESLNGGVDDFVKALQSRPWVAGVRQEGMVLRVMVHNVPNGKQELMPLVVEYGLTLNRYEWVRPSLEEIFLQLSA
jgi:hypothetical protein